MKGAVCRWPTSLLNPAATALPIARHGLKARNTSPNSTLSPTRPSQKVTKMNVTEKFRSGASTPSRPVQTTKASSSAPIAPQSACAGIPRSVELAASPKLRQPYSSNLTCRHPSVRPTKEAIRMIDEPQAKSQSGSGRSERPTRPWAAADEGSRAAVTAALRSAQPRAGANPDPRPRAARRLTG